MESGRWFHSAISRPLCLERHPSAALSETAVTTAKGTLRDVRVAEVVKQDLDVGDDDQVTYRIKLQLSFKYEGGPA